MELNLPDDANRKDADKAYLFGLLQAGHTITEVKEKSGYSRDTIYRKIKEYGFKQVWIQTDPPTAASASAPAQPATPQSTSRPAPNSPASRDLLEPKIRAKVDAMKARKKKG